MNIQNALRLISLFMAIVTLQASFVIAQTQPASQPAPVAFTPIAHVEKRGDGPMQMVLIPGLSCDWTVFESFMDRNKSRYTMYAVTLPGFGESEPPPTPAEGQFGAWLDNAAKAVWKVVQDQHIEKPVIVGHSLGGHLALRIGTEHPRDIRAVVAIDGAPAFPFGATSATLTKAQRLGMAQQMGDRFKSLPADQWALSQRQMVAAMVSDEKRASELGDLCVKVPAATSIQYMIDLVAADIRDQLPHLNAPTLVLPSAATSDPAMIATLKKNWTDLMQGAPNVKFAFFENTRHFIQDDRPAELDAAISDFLAGREAKGYAVPSTQPTTQPGTSKP